MRIVSDRISSPYGFVVAVLLTGLALVTGQVSAQEHDHHGSGGVPDMD
jgi:hypothetical protein